MNERNGECRKRRKEKEEEGKKEKSGEEADLVIWGELELEVSAGLPREIDIQQAAGHLASSRERFRLERQIQGV